MEYVSKQNDSNLNFILGDYYYITILYELMQECKDTMDCVC